MVSLTSNSTHFALSPHLLGLLNFPIISSVTFLVNPTRQLPSRQLRTVCFQGGVCAGSMLLTSRKKGIGRRCWCKVWEEGDDVGLEEEILEFMRNSEKPDVFPTKKELIDSGRMDLVKAIRKKGGWFSLGYDSEYENEDVKVSETDISMINWYSDAEEEFKCKVQGYEASNSVETDEILYSEAACVSTSTPLFDSVSNDKSIGLAVEEVAGIEGILNRLERQRNLSFGIDLGKGCIAARDLDKDDEDYRHLATSTDADRADLGKSSRPEGSSKAVYDNLGGRLSLNGSISNFDSLEYPSKPDTWRNWSIQRAGSLGTEFEAAEICFNKNEMKHEKDVLEDQNVEDRRVDTTEAVDREIINHNHIRTRLQHLEHELSLALKLLRAKGEEFLQKDCENSANDLQKLSDAWEFQENEFMSAQDRLRSTRAKLAVLEGKMALATLDLKKIMEEKQKRIDSARRALRLLRTACIVWPNSGSVVLLAGSFDGWTTQRKMEKSSSGIFSVSLKLYPGRYEIKFIVDGTWKIDPLRSIVSNNGYENNLLVIT